MMLTGSPPRFKQDARVGRGNSWPKTPRQQKPYMVWLEPNKSELKLSKRFKNYLICPKHIEIK